MRFGLTNASPALVTADGEVFQLCSAFHALSAAISGEPAHLEDLARLYVKTSPDQQRVHAGVFTQADLFAFSVRLLQEIWPWAHFVSPNDRNDPADPRTRIYCTDEVMPKPNPQPPVPLTNEDGMIVPIFCLAWSANDDQPGERVVTAAKRHRKNNNFQMRQRRAMNGAAGHLVDRS